MLTKEQIIQHLESIQEHKMAKDIFVPVLKKMGLKGVKFTGGPDEQGIDIEYYEFTEPERSKSPVGIQFKKGNITYGSGGGKGTVKEVKNQAEEAFEKEIYDLDGKSIGFIGRFVVGVTGVINEPARKFIGRARQKGFDRRIDYWDGDRLAEYIQNNWMSEFISYFEINSAEEVEDEIDIQIVDEEYILDNYHDLVKKCIRVKSTVSGIEFDMLSALAELGAIQGFTSGVPMSDFLIEIGRPEDYIEQELRNLISVLGYIETDENQLYLHGHAVSLTVLLDTIVNELIEAEEDLDEAYQLFLDLLQ